MSHEESINRHVDHLRAAEQQERERKAAAAAMLREKKLDEERKTEEILALCARFYDWARSVNLPPTHEAQVVSYRMWSWSRLRFVRYESRWGVDRWEIARHDYQYYGGGGMFGDTMFAATVRLLVDEKGNVSTDPDSKSVSVFSVSEVERGIARIVYETGIPWTG
jgi:hypothetical protein